jgi:hypothetical protein
MNQQELDALKKQMEFLRASTQAYRMIIAALLLNVRALAERTGDKALISEIGANLDAAIDHHLFDETTLEQALLTAQALAALGRPTDKG